MNIYMNYKGMIEKLGRDCIDLQMRWFNEENRKHLRSIPPPKPVQKKA